MQEVRVRASAEHPRDEGSGREDNKREMPIEQVGISESKEVMVGRQAEEERN